MRGVLAGLALSGLACLAPGVRADDPPFSFVVLGDTQDVSPAGLAATGAFLSAVDARQPAFMVHVGDLKGTSEVCDDALFESLHALLDGAGRPLVYTPGDNDWTDCHIAPAGGFDPRERLARLRSLFFPSGRSLGRQPMAVERAEPDYPENARWRAGGVFFATLHIIGTNNNLRAEPGAFEEHMQRSAANLAWLQETFSLARADDAAGVVLLIHANPRFGEGGWWRPTGFDAFVEALTRELETFRRPVLLVHGDTHRFRIDKPLRDRRGRLRAQFTRLEVFGPPTLGAVEVLVDPGDPDLFGFQAFVADRRP